MKQGRTPMFAVVEKSSHHAVHGLFDSQERADRHLREIIPAYVRAGFFSDKTLVAASFEVIPYE